MSKTKLIPPDHEQCQAQTLPGSFMTFGPREWKRCSNKPVFIATENRPRKDGKRGSMSLCQECAKVMMERLGAKHATLESINETKADAKEQDNVKV